MRNLRKKKNRGTFHGPTKAKRSLESGHFRKRNLRGAQTKTLPLHKKSLMKIQALGRKKQPTRQTSSISSASSYLKLTRMKRMKSERRGEAGGNISLN